MKTFFATTFFLFTFSFIYSQDCHVFYDFFEKAYTENKLPVIILGEVEEIKKTFIYNQIKESYSDKVLLGVFPRYNNSNKTTMSHCIYIEHKDRIPTNLHGSPLIFIFYDRKYICHVERYYSDWFTYYLSVMPRLDKCASQTLR